MTVVSNDPSWWPIINANLSSSYFVVASCVGVMYDWGLMLGQEVELVWRQRWSLMTILYLFVRYVGIGYAVISLLLWVPTISTTDAGCRTMYDVFDWTGVATDAIVGVIVIARIHSMYLGSRKVLIFLVVIFVAIRIANVVMIAITMTQISGEGFILFGTFQCMIGYAGDAYLLISMTWILGTVWEVLVLCLAVWIAVMHFRELRQNPTRGILGDCFRVLMQTHMGYFASFLVVSCFEMSYLSPTISTDLPYLETQIYSGFVQIFQIVQMFVLGPRLILSLREYHAKLVADSDTATDVTSIAFQERVRVETSSSV